MENKNEKDVVPKAQEGDVKKFCSIYKVKETCKIIEGFGETDAISMANMMYAVQKEFNGTVPEGVIGGRVYLTEDEVEIWKKIAKKYSSEI